MTADLYAVTPSRGALLLCHRSHFNRGEYTGSAKKLSALGFSCLAIDQRSGMSVLGYTNETSRRANQAGLPTRYADAKQDLEAGLDYLYSLHHQQPLIVLGSSYSASLALLLAAASERVKAVVAFSPLECLKGIQVAESLKALTKPVLVTAARQEMQEVARLVRFVPAPYLTLFHPEAEGVHGAKALWETTPGHEAYWEALQRFLGDE
jgi:alpha-beta hydrolase superfamily lysophospholipase